MTEARWAQVKALFEAAVERPASERAGFLRAAAGSDQLLCRDVESLLRADDPDAALTNLLQQQDARPHSGSIDTNDSSWDDTRTQTTSHQTTIGPYRVVGLLGAGGMGEVFRARDAKLHRDVALKLLPTAFAFDPDRLARFRREARALAALNHPHIGAIYGLEESDGRQALVLELVEGVTLAERIAGGPLPVREALTLARQIAGALEAAHDKGIVHRDLKPANIKVTAAGIVKVLDFGLAKTAAVERMARDVVNESLTADGRTRVGAVVGTAAYMSPEQARGLEVDTRTDIWAFGCVLFEMLSGRKAFGADADSDSKEKVLAREPDWTALPARTPVKVRGLLRRCLEKDPARRLPTIADAHHLVDRLLKGGSWTRRVAAAAVAAAALAAMLASGLVWSGSPAETSSPLFSQLTDAPGVETTPSLSPDDVSLVYASRQGTQGDWEIYSQPIAGSKVTNLTNSLGYDGQPAYSRDGQRIAFRSAREGGGVFQMGATGEDVRRLTPPGFQGFHPTWSPGDKEIAVSTDDVQDPGQLQSAEGRLVVVEVTTGRTRVIAEAVDVHQPHWSPNGFRIAYWGRPGGTGPRDIWTVAANGGAPVPVTNDAYFDWNPVWSPDGRWLYFSSNRGGSMNLWRVRIDETSGTVQGRPESVGTPSPYSGFMSISRSGHRIAYVKVTFDENLFKIAFDPSREAAAGQPTAITRGTRRTFLPDLSPDGESVVAVTHESDGQEDLVLVRTGGNDSPSKLTNGPDRDLDPKWSPNGKTIAFQSNRSGTFQIWMINADGSGRRQFTNADVPMLGPLWSPTGTRMVVESPGGPHGPARAIVLDTHKPWSQQTLEPLRLPLPPGATFSATSWSADEQQLALAMPGGTFVYDFGTGEVRNVSKRGNPRWLSDSRRLFVGGGSSRLDLIDLLSGKVRRDVLTFPAQLNGYSVSSDDRLIVYGQKNDQADIWLASVEDRATGPR